MLNRNAESVYWLGRYLERAENHVRFLDAHYHARYPMTDDLDIWRGLLQAIGDAELFYALHASPTPPTVLQFLMLDDTWPNSVIRCIANARINLRNVRDRLPPEIWDALNGLYLWLREYRLERRPDQSAHDVCKAVRERIVGIHGAMHAVVTRDTSWHLMESGRYLERAENSTRIMQFSGYFQTFGETPYAYHLAVLHSVGGYESFRRKYREAFDANAVTEFLLIDEKFPRSVGFSLSAFQAHISMFMQRTSERDEQFLRTLNRLLAELTSFDRNNVDERRRSTLLTTLANTISQIDKAMVELLFTPKGGASLETRNLSRHTLFVPGTSVRECQ